jgi:DNA (cytosine-5)-methyltransferase 1
MNNDILYHFEIQNFINHVKITYDKNKVLVFWVDLFCGAGGTSTGIHLTGGNNYVAACVNHDENAIKSHEKNHPNTIHFTEDIRDFLVVTKLAYLVKKLRLIFPDCYINLWGSLECTNFSKAKGGQSRNADSRTLADHLFPYIEFLSPDYLWIENVREFMCWGPLDENGKPISKNNGKDYLKWVDLVKKSGYDFDWKLLNAADFGAYQSRERLFLQFPKKGFPISWPQQTHSKKGDVGTFFDIPKWKQVKEILDLKDHGKSIFNRKKPLADKTIQVIIKGLIKAVKEGEDTFMFKYYGNGDNYNSINDPSGTVTTKDRFAIVHLIFNQYKSGNVSNIDRPIGTVTTTPKCNLLTFILNPSHGGHTSSIDRPGPTVIARQDKAPLYILNAIIDQYGIVDIKMRMAKISELLQMQGFPANYKLVGNQSQKKKFIGNAVEVNQAKVLVESNYKSISNFHKELKLKLA